MKWPALLAGLAALGVMVGGGRVDAQSTLGAPTIGTITATTNSLTVPWTAPSDTGGAAVTTYDLRYIRTDGDETVPANWTVIAEVWTTGGGTLEHELEDLPDGLRFDVQVRAENATGDVSAWSATVARTTTDHGGTTSSATDLALGSSLAGRINPATDEDVFEITLGSDGEVWIYATGLLDTYGELLNGGGRVLEESGDGTILDGPRGFEFREELTAGTYYIRVSSEEARETGAYRIHAQTFTDPGDTFATATTVTLDSVAPGRIGPRGGSPDRTPPGDVDYFKLVLSARTDVWVMAWGTTEAEGLTLDTVGVLYDSGENRIVGDDDSEIYGNEEGFLLRRELAAGTYYIGVQGFFAEDAGPYTLHVRTAEEPGSTTATATPLSLRVPATGNIASSSDRDYFSLTLADDLYVYIYALAIDRTLPLTPTILDHGGNEVSMHVIPHANWREHGVRAFGFSVWGRLDAGTYHIRIAPSGSATGSYLLAPRASPYNRMLRECTAITTSQSDSWYGCQWHLNNTGQFDGGAMEDINVESVWTGGNMGAGIHVAIVDDGIEPDHVDLVDNVVAARNHDFAGQGGVYDPLDTHGTAVAGIIAARDNNIGVRGVAPRASIFAYNLIARGSSVSDNQASAMYKSEDAQITAISNNSWGAVPDGLPIGAPATWERAVVRGVTTGYGGKGILYVVSGGNGHLDANNNANLDGRVSFYAVVAACAVGYDDRRSDYSEMGANLWVCAPSSSGRDGLPRIATTHIPDRYQDSFGGTSAAAPIVSGVSALVRAANTNLTWRDVKLILAASARKNDATDSGWERGAPQYGSTTDRYDFNHAYGFGMVDAAAAVALADGWTNVPAMRTHEAWSGPLGEGATRGAPLPDRVGDTLTTVSSALSLDAYVQFVEFVEVEIGFDHPWFRDLRIQIESPSGAVSDLSVPATSVAAFSGRFTGTHRFGSAKHLGENAKGTWTVKVTDEQSDHSGSLMAVRLKVYGHGNNPGYVTLGDPVPGGGSIAVTWEPPTEAPPDVTSYDVRYIRDDAADKSDSNWTVATGVGSLTARTHTITGLAGEQQYLVAVRAVNGSGNGPWVTSDAVGTLALGPGQPPSVSAAARNEGLAVSWREPSYLGAGITAYDVWYIRDDAPDKSDAFWNKVARAWSAGGGELRYIIGGLDNGVTYRVRIRATTTGADGDWSAIARGTPRDINSAAEFPSTESGRRGIPENTAAGVGIGGPVSARDDESDTRTYSLTSGAANFDIVPTTGQLLTKVALDHERISVYSVTVAVHDGKASDGTASTVTDDTIRVIISIEDVDEPPVVGGAETPAVRENVTAVATYRATDPERATTAFAWSLAGADASAFTISATGALSFDPAPDFEARTDNTYDVIVRATDQSATEASAMTGELEVEVTVGDVDEPPGITGTARHTIVENGPTRVGSYTVTDPEGAAVTWLTLAGADARHFTLDEFGALSFAETPDFDRATNGNHGPGYRVTVRASDEGNRIGMLPVTITLTGVNEGPLIEGDGIVHVDEGHTGTLDTYTKRDPERSATNWGAVGSATALGGSDAFDFDQATGRLTFKEPPDFEDGGGSYAITLTANDGVLPGTLDVTINVANLDERGEVKLNGPRGVINLALQASLSDGDGVVTADWQWQRSTSRTSGWVDITNADSRTYTPTAADRDHYLRATVTYEDGHGTDKGANAVTRFTTVNERGSNTAPLLPDSVDAIAIPEDTPAGRNVGSRIRATDAENDPLVYTLSGASAFEIGRTTGQIRVASGATFDYDQGTRSYALTATAADGFGGVASVAVTVNIEDVNEPPIAVGDAPRVVEDTPTEIDVLANDRDPEGGALSVVSALPDRPRGGTATVDPATNRITYTPRPDYHGADSFTYRIRDDGSPRRTSGKATVSITVNEVNDAPAFASSTAARSVAESAEAGDEVGAPVTATDVDTGDTLSYRLLGAGAAAFDIDGDGQITVSAGITFDITVQDTYEVTVEASDEDFETARIDVTITVTTRPTAPLFVFIGGGGGGGGGPSGPIPSTVDFEWTVDRDIEALDEAHDGPSGAVAVGGALLLLQNGQGSDDAVYAYSLATGERDEGAEFDLGASNRAPRGIWSDGVTAWVSDSGQDRLFAYGLESDERDEEREIELANRNSGARGIWSAGPTIRVLDGDRDALFAYALDTGELLAEYELDPANSDPRGLWSDGVTIWVSDHTAKRLFAYRLPAAPEAPREDDPEPVALERVEGEEFSGLSAASNNSPRGIWSDGELMYVADASDGKVYTYNMPDAIDARLVSLEVSRVDFGEFSPLRLDYASEGAPDGDIATVTALAAQPDATVSVDPADHDGDLANGHRLRLLPGLGIAVTVTSPDGSRTRVYRVLLGKEAGEAGEGPDASEAARPRQPTDDCLRGLVAARFSLVTYRGGSVDDLVACARHLGLTSLYVLEDGQWVSYILGAPEFVNRAFRERYAEDVAAATVLIAQRAAGGR